MDKIKTLKRVNTILTFPQLPPSYFLFHLQHEKMVAPSFTSMKNMKNEQFLIYFLNIKPLKVQHNRF